MEKKTIRAWVAIGVLVAIIACLFTMWRSAQKNAREYQSELNNVMDETCYEKYQELDGIKEQHNAAMSEVKDLYMQRGAAQFEAQWGTGKTENVQALYTLIQDKESSLSGLEAQGWLVRQSIANCNP